MGDFKNRPLRVLDRIYGFLSGKSAVSAVQLGTPITLVHDVSRESEFGAGYGEWEGMGCQNVTITTVAGGTDRVQQDAYQWLTAGMQGAVDPLGGNLDIWILGIETQYNTPANLTSLWVGIGNMGQLKPTGGTALETYRTLFFGGGGDYALASNYTATGSVNLGAVSDTIIFPNSLSFPHRCVEGERILVEMHTTAAFTAIIFVYFWAGRRGTTPPGMA